MTLRQLLTHSEKCARDLIELMQTAYMTRMSDFRDLSRPIRRRSHYPTLLALQNALRKLMETATRTQEMAASLHETLEAIQDHANRERVNRM